MKQDMFQRYVDAFNDRRYADCLGFFHPAVQLQLPKHLLKGPEAIHQHYRDLHADVAEHLRVDWYVADEHHLAFDCYTEFTAIRPRPGFTFGPLKVGDTIRMTNFVHYTLQDGLFKNIRVAHYRMSE